MNVLDYATRVEVEGLRLFERLEHETESRELKEIFGLLAATKREHCESLENMKQQINPADAVKLGVGDGEMVRVTSRRGTVEAKAKVTSRSDAGTVFMNFHFHEAAVNRLTNPVLDPVAKIPEYKVCAVNVTAV